LRRDKSRGRSQDKNRDRSRDADTAATSASDDEATADLKIPRRSTVAAPPPSPPIAEINPDKK